jgi:hypothetical protein
MKTLKFGSETFKKEFTLVIRRTKKRWPLTYGLAVYKCFFFESFVLCFIILLIK